ncbi:MAG: hypothetical protein EZS28_010633 [Streblomastix strix]|uniref:Uncharacterized protein n=1 Tax=Streblomastix strix TaxID=222440 RepID=A0A5J4WGN9_9EUKA|nr:MAG: hypothetical protein EZS28_010633 [Streblomastix strix]
MAEKEQQSSSSQEQGISAYDEDRKALLVLAFMLIPEIEAFLADQGFVPSTFDMNDPRFIEKLDALKLYMLSKQMAFEDLTQRFPAMNNTFSKTETQQKMIYAQVANSQEEQLRFFMEHGPRAQLIANSKPGQPVVKRSANEQKRPLLCPRAALAAQDLVDITKRTLEGANAGDTVYQPRVRVDKVALDHLDGEFRKEMAKIVGVHRASQFDPNKMKPRDSRRRSAEQNRWRHENLWATSESAEIYPNETSHAYADCARAVSLAESALIAQILHFILDQPLSRYLINAYLMCLTAGARLRSIRFAHPSQGQSRNQASSNYRSAPAQFPPAHDNGHGGNQCDLNISPVQSERQITELLAAMKIDRLERQNTKRYSGYLEKPKQCLYPRSLKTQDRVQGRLRSTFEFIQDYLVRTGRRRYNPGPGLFRQVLKSDIRYLKEKRRLAQDPRLLNSEQRVANRVFQARWDYRYSGNNNAQRLVHNDRPASRLHSHQSCGRDATVSMLQFQWSLLQLQRDAVWSFNGSENLQQMLPASNS